MARRAPPPALRSRLTAGREILSRSRRGVTAAPRLGIGDSCLSRTGEVPIFLLSGSRSLASVTPPPLDVVLSEAVHVRAVRFLGATGDLWRDAMGRGEEPLAVPPAEGGPFLIGRVVRFDPRLYRAACAALIALGHHAGKPRTAGAVLDGLVDATARRLRETSPFARS